MADDTIIRVEGLWKRYGLPLGPTVRRLGRRLRSGPFGASVAESPEDDGPWALRDVCLEVRRGETLGVIGRNGAGKSTLLKVLAGVTPPTKGRVEVLGSIFPMIELNAGIHAELTGRENVLMLGAVMGLSRQEVRNRLPEIEEFCELGEWFDRPVRKYSTGMLARLGFGVAMNVEADVLLIDEVLAVGDLLFQKKCFDRLEQTRRNGVSVVFVSHNIRQVQRLSDRVLWLHSGQIRLVSSPNEATAQYYDDAARQYFGGVQVGLDPKSQGTEEIAVHSLRIGPADGELTGNVTTGQPMAIEVEFEVLEHLDSVIPGVAIYSSEYIPLVTVKTLPIELRPGRQTIRWDIPECLLMHGAYYIVVAFKSGLGRAIYKSSQLPALTVLPTNQSHMMDALVWLPATWRLRSLGQPEETLTGYWDPRRWE